VKVIVDTSVWSMALRRSRVTATATSHELAELIREGRVVMLGPIRQELLSGIKTQGQFERLCGHLRAFPDLVLETADYEDAASAFNQCRGRGVQGSNTDFLICAVSLRRNYSIFTADDDFQRFAGVVGIRLHDPRF